MKLIGEKASINELLKTIDSLGSYPIVELNDSDLSIRVLPTTHDLYENGGIGFQVNNGSIDRRTPQMTCFKLNSNAKIIKVDETQIPKNVASIKTYLVKTSREDNYVLIYFPKHLTKNNDFSSKGIFKNR
jgi:hypothetical protein